MGAFSIYVQPLGFVQFGPVVGFEIGTGSNLMLDGHWRYSAAGLVYRAIATGFDPDEELESNAMAFGGGLRYFISTGRTPHRPYIGGIFEYGWESGVGDRGYTYEWEWETRYVGFGLQGGYRFRIGSTFFLGIGGLLGMAPEIYSNWEYVDRYLEEESESTNDVHPFGMIELLLGFEFGRQ